MPSRKAESVHESVAELYFTIERYSELREARDRLAERVGELERRLAEASQRSQEREEALRHALAVSQEELHGWEERCRKALERAVELGSRAVAGEREAARLEDGLSKQRLDLLAAGRREESLAKRARGLAGAVEASCRQAREAAEASRRQAREAAEASRRQAREAAEELARTRALLDERGLAARAREVELQSLLESSETGRAAAQAACREADVGALTRKVELSWGRVFGRLADGVAGAARELAAAQKDPNRAPVRLRGAQERLGQAEDLARLFALHESPVEFKPVALSSALNSALKAWNGPFKARSIVVARRWEGFRGACQAQPERLGAALYQILLNAYEAMPRGGLLTVETSLQADVVTVTITDNGGGFSAAALKNPFEPCAAPRAGHLGVGLAVARALARQMAGELAADNHKTGARLSLALFRADEDAQARSAVRAL